MKKILSFLLSFFILVACKKDVNLSFSEVNEIYNDNAIVEINIPKASGNKTISNSINSTIEKHIATALNFGEDDSKVLSYSEAISNFEKEFHHFKNEYDESTLVYEATFDGEVIYQSAGIICVAITGYTNTGGAHGNLDITLYNFNSDSGKLYSNDELIINEKEFTQLVKTHFINEIDTNSEELSDYFFGDDFHLPANIGFNDEGVLILYNTYEIASYAQGITEFTIPFSEANPFIKIN
jgi:hypothetical protein